MVIELNSPLAIVHNLAFIPPVMGTAQENEKDSSKSHSFIQLHKTHLLSVIELASRINPKKRKA